MDPQREDYDDGPTANGHAWRLPRRAAVLGPGLLVGAVLAGVWCLTDDLLGSMGNRVQAWGIILAGPVSAVSIGVTPAYCWALMAFLAAPAILAHPVRPNRWTGVLTVAALLLWFFTGLLTVVIMCS